MHNLAVRMLIKIADGQGLHVTEHVATQPQHGALTDVDHDAVVCIRAERAKQQHRRKGDEGARQGCVVGIGGLGERQDIIVNQRTREKR